MSDFVETLATLGAILLLFVIGLEINPRHVFKPKYALIAGGGVIVPWVAGFLVAHAFGYPLGVATFVGAALTATSIAITAHVLREAKLLNSEAAKAIIGAAVVDDVLALLAIGVSSSIAISGAVDTNVVLQAIVGAVLFLAAGLTAGSAFIQPALIKLSAWARKNGQSEITFLAAIAVAFAYAFIAELVGLSAIVGSFLAGVSLENFRDEDVRKSARNVEVLFSAIFFVSLGVLVDVHAALSSLPFVIVLTLAAIVSKYAGAKFTARGVGLNKDESSIVGWGMVPRGEIAFVAALIGRSTGLIDAALFASILLMSLITTMVAPPLIQRAIERHARRRP